MKPRVLLAHSTFWPNVARLAIGFHKAGFEVEVVAPSGHPVHRMHSPHRTYVYRASSPIASLQDAIESSRPDLVISADDRVAAHLRRLHAICASGINACGPTSLAALLERSIGPPSSFPFLEHRGALAELAPLSGVHIARTEPIASIEQLYDWADKNGLPAVLKLDRSSGGSGVVLVPSRQGIPKAYRKIKFRQGALIPLKNAALHGDIEPLYSLFQMSKPAITVQPFISGGLANCAIACWRGEVLGSVAVEVVQNNKGFASATVVRMVEGPEMVAAATAIAEHLQLSGLCGFDFVLSDAIKKPILIEINPRATQIDHLSQGPGADLASAFWRAITGEPKIHEMSNRRFDEIALFPGEWRRSRHSKYLVSAYHDVPYEEPVLLEYYRYKFTQELTRRQVPREATSERII